MPLKTYDLDIEEQHLISALVNTGRINQKAAYYEAKILRAFATNYSDNPASFMRERLPTFLASESMAGNGYQQITNLSLNLDERIKPVDVSNVMPNQKITQADVKQYLVDLAKNNFTMSIADGKAVLSIAKSKIKHITYSSKKRTPKQEKNIRNTGILSITDLLSNAVFVETIHNTKKDKKPKILNYHRFYVPIQKGNNIYTVRIVAEEYSHILTVNSTSINLYDVIIEDKYKESNTINPPTKDGTQIALPSNVSIKETLKNVKEYFNKRKKDGTINPALPGVKIAPPPDVSIREMLANVKDYYGNPYINPDGTGNFIDYNYQQIGDEEYSKGAYDFQANIIHLFEGADASTVIHETAHFFLEEMWRMIQSGQASEMIENDFDKLIAYGGMNRTSWAIADIEGRRECHERIAEAFETYIMEGKAPSPELDKPFKRFSGWLKDIYHVVRDEYLNSNRSDNAIALTDEVRGVFNRLLADDNNKRRSNTMSEHIKFDSPFDMYEFMEQERGNNFPDKFELYCPQSNELITLFSNNGLSLDNMPFNEIIERAKMQVDEKMDYWSGKAYRAEYLSPIEAFKYFSNNYQKDWMVADRHFTDELLFTNRLYIQNEDIREYTVGKFPFMKEFSTPDGKVKGLKWATPHYPDWESAKKIAAVLPDTNLPFEYEETSFRIAGMSRVIQPSFVDDIYIYMM